MKDSIEALWNNDVRQFLINNARSYIEELHADGFHYDEISDLISRMRRGEPHPGHWAEIFNGDVYENWVNPAVAGNGGGIDAWGPPMHWFVASAGIVIPANGFVVFARA